MAEAAAAAATLAVVAQAYAATLAPSVVGGDTGELLAEACGLGTAHPPGYPVFTLLVHAAHRLAQAQGGGVTTAHAANALCAAFGALAACLVASSTVALLRQCPRLRVDGVVAAAAGAAAGCGYALSPLCWQYHITAEVFALNNLLCAALVRAALWVAEAPSPAALRTGAAVAGVALCNQHTSVLFAVPLVVWVLVACRRVWAERPSELAKTAAAFLLALAPYAYLPVAALAREQKGSWGNVKTFGGFLWHLRRGDYGTLQLYSGKTGDGNARLYGRLAAYAADLHRGQGLGVAVPLAVAGALATVYCGARGTSPPPGPPPAAAGKRKRSKGQGAKAKERPGKGPPAAAPGGGGGLAAAFAATDGHTVAVALAATMAVYLVVFHTLANLPLDNPLLFGIHQRFWMQPNLLAFTWAGCGFAALVGAAPLPAAARRGLAVAAACAFVTAQRQANVAEADQSANRHFAGYAAAILEPLPPNAVLLINYDMQWTSVRYMQVCEGLRPDVTAINLSMMTFAWWHDKQAVYPDIAWPGTHYTQKWTEPWAGGKCATCKRHDCPEKCAGPGGSGFSIDELLDANPALVDGPGGVFVGGKLNFVDGAADGKYEYVAYGITARVVRDGAAASVPGHAAWARETRAVWATARARLGLLPSSGKYDGSYWEATIVRETWDHLADFAAQLLATALAHSQDQEYLSLPAADGVGFAYDAIDAARMLECVAAGDRSPGVLLGDGKPGLAPPAVYKNLGLAYLHLLKSRGFNDETHFPADAGDLPAWCGIQEHLAGAGEGEGALVEYAPEEGVSDYEGYTAFAGARFVWAWREYLGHPLAADEEGYARVLETFNAVVPIFGGEVWVPPPKAKKARKKRKRGKAP